MADIFLSYARADEDKAAGVRQALGAADYEVIWDRDLQPGTPDWDSGIRAMLNKSRCVVVLWSTVSIASNPVRQEAALAKSMQKPLLQVLVDRLDAVQLPMGLFHEQAADLSGWSGSADAPAIKQLITALQGILGPGTYSVRKRAEAEERMLSLQVEADGFRRQIAELSQRLRTSQGERDSAVSERANLQAEIQSLTGQRDAAESQLRDAERERDQARKQVQAAKARRVSTEERPVVRRAGLGLIGVSIIALMAASLGFWGGKANIDTTVLALLPSGVSRPTAPTDTTPILSGSEVHEDTPPGTVFKDCGYCPEMVVVRIEGMTFESGRGQVASTGEITRAGADEAFGRTRAFAVSRFEITRREFLAFDPEVMRYRDDCRLPDDHPIVCLSSHRDGSVRPYVAWLSSQTGQEYGLPTALQFDALIQAGGVLDQPTNEICNFANLRDRSSGEQGSNLDCSDGAQRQARVGSYAADRLGLYDVVGNVSELVEPNSGSGYWDHYRIIGGSYYSPFSNLFVEDPDDDAPDRGFRVIRRLAPSPNAESAAEAVREEAPDVTEPPAPAP
jgi:formylglycine-generating enzyme required for sulfatase activity